MSATPECGSMRELLPELAAGALAGDERARALSHLAGCAACRRDLEESTQVVEALIALAPRYEPPAAFENMVLARIAAEPGVGRAAARLARRDARPWWRRSGWWNRSPRPSGEPIRWKRLAVRLAAAAVVAALAAGTVWQATAPDRELAAGYRQTLNVADGRYLSAAALYSDRRPGGVAFGYQGSPSWIFLVIDAPSASGVYRMTLTTRYGTTTELGDITISTGRASWGTSIPGDLADVSKITLSRPGVADIVAAFGP